jgi:hypothetical protein
VAEIISNELVLQIINPMDYNPYGSLEQTERLVEQGDCICPARAATFPQYGGLTEAEKWIIFFHKLTLYFGCSKQYSVQELSQQLWKS